MSGDEMLETIAAYKIEIFRTMNCIFINSTPIPGCLQMLSPGPSEGLVGVLLADTIQLNVDLLKDSTQEGHVAYHGFFDAPGHRQMLMYGFIRGRICKLCRCRSKCIHIEKGRQSNHRCFPRVDAS
jgi:hypothetical protein